MNYGSQSMVAPLRRVIVKNPQAAFGDQRNIDMRWAQFNFLDRPDFKLAIEEHDKLVELLRQNGSEVLFLDADPRTNLDSIYAHDPGIVTDHGAIVFQTGKELRRGEGPAMADELEKWDIPLIGKVDQDATAEAGDMVWLDHQTLLIGHGFRTNTAGVAKMRLLLQPYDIRVLEFHLPYWSGPGDVLHLMSFLSLLDEDLAVVHRPLMPVPLFQLLQQRGIEMIDVAPTEYDTLGCNVLALSPRNVLMVEGSPITRSRLEAAGCKVQEFSGKEIAYKGTGGPTCLTRPLWRL